MNIHELFNTIEIKRPVRHFPIYDFFIQFRTRAYNCKMKKTLFSFAVFVNSDMRRKMNITGFGFFFLFELNKLKNTVFHLGFFCCWKNYPYIFRQSSGHLFQLLSDLLGKRDFIEQFLVKPKLTSE